MEFESDILNCLEVLKKGGLILYPTDTIWGIGCDATSAKAIEKINTLKKRSVEKSMIVLVADEKEILRHVAQPDLQVFNYLSTVKKPTTVIYEGAIGLADNLVNKDGSIAIRICKEEFCRHLIKRFKKPIVSTSANISSEPFPKKFSEISAEIKGGVDYIVEYRQNEKTISAPSTLIKWEKNKPIILRS
jgi:L-threonylcarbamoyladenylate synthase